MENKCFHTVICFTINIGRLKSKKGGIKMKSIKPGRGPSAMGAMGSIVAVVFGIFWTITAFSSGAPSLFPIFGVMFIIIGIVQTIYHFTNATGKNRFSEYDITDTTEESDPFEVRFSKNNTVENTSNSLPTGGEIHYCPYCGTKVNGEFEFCHNCGKKLP